MTFGRVAFLKYAVVGALATLLDLLVTLSTVPLFPHYLFANTLGFVVANVAQFLVAHRWVFGGVTRLSTRQAFLATLGISVAALGLSNILVYFFVDMCLIDLLPAKLLTACITLILNYAVRRLTVYSQ